MISVELACDGSGSVRGTPAGWAWILRAIDNETGEIRSEREGFGGMVHSSSQRAELTALLRGLQALKKKSSLTVITDSEYLANPFKNGYVKSWLRKDFAKVKNTDLWRPVIVEVTKHEVEWQWVKGHTGHPQNERCDELAGGCRKAIKLAIEARSLAGLDFEVDEANPYPEQLPL